MQNLTSWGLLIVFAGRGEWSSTSQPPPRKAEQCGTSDFTPQDRTGNNDLRTVGHVVPLYGQLYPVHTGVGVDGVRIRRLTIASAWAVASFSSRSA